MSQVRRASSVRRRIRAREDSSPDAAGVNHVGHVLEHASFDDDHSAAIDLECMSGIGVPVVVDGVEEGIAANFWEAAGRMVDVVTFHGHEIGGAVEVDAPVMVAVACRRPGCRTVDFIIGDRDSIIG